ncbi:hypothetical protein B0T25DRAFT_130631 [Lasiosphaeria hispida]|uniref:SET domain-containing protein n=1 Tax=Lasiosphaeria hispida TaxID=260671 RepID=A0AAJ0MIN4_9PEZI|nr:hypothetical protein B0T25DRAFT_130631 [Lasiosphaeria hispida]
MAPSPRLLTFLTFTLTLTLLTQAQQTQTPLPHPFTPQTCPTPFDDDSPASQAAHLPWTSPPYCLTPRSIGSAQKFCLYTAAAYNLGAGLSVLTTPDAAASLAAAVADTLPAWHARDHLASGGRLSKEQEGRVKYKVVRMEGKGMGVVATRRIDKFETIMVSLPAVVVDNEFLPAEEDEAPAEGGKFWRRVQGVGDWERVERLARSREGVNVVEDVVRTNAFGVRVEGREGKGLYPEIARLNHACDPNAFPRFTRSDLAMRAVATRDILPGEEITISYIPLGMPTPHRLRSLSNWGFNCTCALCTSPPAARDASDTRRHRLVEVYYAMQEPGVSYEELVELTREFVQTVEVERLDTKIGEYYQAFMRIYYNAGDAESALKYARLGLKYSEAFADPEGGFCSGLRADLKFLEAQMVGGK